jgi:hypothetical protein
LTGHDPQHAFENYIRQMREALQCITRERLMLANRTERISAGPGYPIEFSSDEPIPLRVEPGYPPIGFTIAQSVRIMPTGSPTRQERFIVSVVRYTYALTTVDGKEVLAFHWAPDLPIHPAFPHLHVGAINLDPNSPIRPGTFHKMHIPTGHITVEAVIRLAITELNVRPLRPDWEQVLERTEQARSRR